MFNLYLCLLPLFLLIVSLHLIASLLFLFKNISWDTKDTFLLPAYDMLTTQISAFLLISSMLFTLWPQFAICSYNPVLCSPVLVSRWNSVSYQIYKIHLRKYQMNYRRSRGNGLLWEGSVFSSSRARLVGKVSISEVL